MAVSPEVLAHEVSASAGEVLMGIAVFPIGCTNLGSLEKLGDGYKLCQRSISIQPKPMREKVKSLKHVITCRQVNSKTHYN